MKTKIVVVAAGAFALVAIAAAAAFAQMPHGPASGANGALAMHDGRGMHDGGMHREMHGRGMHGSHGGPRDGAQGHGRTATHAGQQDQPKGDRGPASLALRAVNAQMHEAMDIGYTGNADVDFAKAMIPHHQGAIDMAKVVAAFGKDPEVRKLAESIIKAQEEEIAWMTKWLKENAQQ